MSGLTPEQLKVVHEADRVGRELLKWSKRTPIPHMQRFFEGVSDVLRQTVAAVEVERRAAAEAMAAGMERAAKWHDDMAAMYEVASSAHAADTAVQKEFVEKAGEHRLHAQSLRTLARQA